MIDLFYNITDEEKQRIFRLLEADILTFKKDNFILSSIRQSNVIGVVISGYLQIITDDYNGNRIIIEELEENSIFGTSISSISNNDYDIICKEDSKIIIMDYQSIISVDNNSYTYYNQFMKNLFQIIYNKTKEKNERIEILTKKSIRNKLLEYFRIASKKSGSKIIYINRSFMELADYISVDRCAMSRELKNLKDEGFIKIDHKKITLLY